ncbi:aerial mycelium formation protein [Amycolatopsis antarctica]|uniref:Aerial mycelium formation protein n=1 Tax=Amycolatopsis antarctica TaxID=1854586 RepID=A0A263CZV5_9PSEU|nr:aerial mycelium formation protein [Amycolatopsis antarctica]OZM71499.1 aerial mycelium formation protein [Amycolatopsis antarctica]
MIEVRPGGRRRIDRVLAEDYVRALGDLPLADLRDRRNEAAQEETDLSYLRRLLHVRIDIVLAEQTLRSSGGTGSVVDRLASILADNALGPATGSGRHQPLEPSRAGEHRRQAEALVGDSDLSDVSALSDDKLVGTLGTYREQEASVSQRRREVQDVVDTLNAEIAGRYATGMASVDELISRERGRPGKDERTE